MGTKVLVIGLDGATPELVERWVAEEKLPYLKQIMREGVYGTLKSTYPPISPAAWATFATGYNPGKHGTFDFRDYEPRRYSCFADTIVDSRALAGRTIWDLVGANGQKVGVITVPITYPVWQVNGFMISGYPTPDAAKSFAYPPELAARIPALTEDSAFFKSAAPPEVLRELNRLTHLRTDVAVEQLQRDDFGLFIMVIGATDRAHHDWWKYIDPSHPAYDSRQAQLYGDYVLQVYQAADACIGRLLAAIDEDTTVIVLSDHGGMAHPAWYFNTNSWLRSLGLLVPHAKHNGRSSRVRTAYTHFYRTRIRRVPYLERVYRALPATLKSVATTLDAQAMMNLDAIDWKHTAAYRFPMYPPVEGIMVNVAGRQVDGCIQPGEEYEEVRSRILRAARELRDPRTGESLIVEAYRREELYTGECVHLAPDLIVVTRDAYKGGTSVDELISAVPLDILTKLSGVHRMDGVVLARGPRIRRGAVVEGAGIIDVAPTILSILGLPVPTDMDGELLAALFEDEMHPAYTDTPAYGELVGHDHGYTEDEEESVKVKLQGLGYL